MSNENKIKEEQEDWPVTFEQVEEDHLIEMAKATPVQRLLMAEELMKLVELAQNRTLTR